MAHCNVRGENDVAPIFKCKTEAKILSVMPAYQTCPSKVSIKNESFDGCT